MRIITSVVLLALAAVMTLPARAQEKPADVAGTWAITVETGGGTGTPTLRLTQSGETLTGTIEGTAVKVTYTGTVETVTMKGKVTIGDLGEGTFTAKKQ